MTVPFNTFQRQPYLKLQWGFPTTNIPDLSSEVDKSYIDIASKVNQRIIGNYAINFLSFTGERWYFSGSSTPQQSLRQVYPFTTSGNIAHGLNWSSVSSISPRSYGTFTDGTNWYGCIYGSNVAIAGQISFYVTNTNIVVLSGAGAPAIVSGYIDLEFLSIF